MSGVTDICACAPTGSGRWYPGPRTVALRSLISDTSLFSPASPPTKSDSVCLYKGVGGGVGGLVEYRPCNILAQDEESLLVSSALVFLFFQLWCFLSPLLFFCPFPSTPTHSSLPLLSSPLGSFSLLLNAPLLPSTHLKWTQLGENIAFWRAGTEVFQRSLRVYCMCACVIHPQPPRRLPLLQL